MKNVLLYGNGLNLVTGKFPEWKQLVSGSGFTSRKGNNSTMPYTLTFELGFQNNDEDIMVSDSNLKKGIQDKLKETVVSIISDNTCDKSLYDKIIDLKMDHYLTTNYDNFIYEYLKNKGYSISAMDRTEDVYSLRRYYTLVNDNKEYRIWNIHGDVRNYKSMIIGYDHYCGYLWKLNSFIKGSYKYETPGGHKKELKQSVIARIINKSIFKLNPLISWADLFFTCNIHIMGLGLSFNEIDLWWLLNYRGRLLKNNQTKGKINNKIYFYAYKVDEDIEDALKAFGVEVVKTDVPPQSDGSETNEQRIAYYTELIEKMRNNM